MIIIKKMQIFDYKDSAHLHHITMRSRKVAVSVDKAECSVPHPNRWATSAAYGEGLCLSSSMASGVRDVMRNVAL